MSYGEINSLHRDLEALETKDLQRGDGERDDLLLDAALLEARARRLGIPQVVAATMLRRAAILNSAKRWREAVAVVEDARTTMPDTGPAHLAVSALSKLAEAYAGLQDWHAVSAVSAEGIALVEKDRYKVSAPYMQSSYLRFAESLYQLGVRAAFEVGDVPLLLERAELAKARGTLRSRSARAGTTAGDEDLERRFRHVGRLLEQAGDGESHRDPHGESHGLPRADVHALRAERRRLWDQLAIKRLRHVTGEEPPDFRLDAVTKRLAADEAVVYYFWVDTHRLLIVTLDSERVVREQRLFTDAQIEELAQETNLIISLRPNERLSDQFFRKWSWLLPEVDWLTPADGKATSPKTRLLISPHQTLHALPFHALWWRDQYVIERFAVTFIPNLSSLLLGYRPAARSRVLSIGIGEYDLPGRRIQPQPLAHAEGEARAIADLYWDAGVPSTGLYNAAASAARLRRWASEGSLARFTHVHIAGHAENILGDTPLESHVYLHDAVLDGLEIAGWRLPADLVVLSACSAGQRAIGGRGLTGVPGDELFGLQAAFFTAGASKIISPLWPVADDVGMALMIALHRHLLTGCTPEVAHQRAVKEFLASARLNRRRPHYWAPFYVTALGRPDRDTRIASDNRGDHAHE
jgi:CHAT domain-containing protein